MTDRSRPELDARPSPARNAASQRGAMQAAMAATRADHPAAHRDGQI